MLVMQTAATAMSTPENKKLAGFHVFDDKFHLLKLKEKAGQPVKK